MRCEATTMTTVGAQWCRCRPLSEAVGGWLRGPLHAVHGGLESRADSGSDGWRVQPNGQCDMESTARGLSHGPIRRCRGSTLHIDTAPPRAVSLSGGRISAISRAFDCRCGGTCKLSGVCNSLLSVDGRVPPEMPTSNERESQPAHRDDTFGALSSRDRFMIKDGR